MLCNKGRSISSIIVIFTLAQWITPSSSLSLWANSVHGVDFSECGVNATVPCNSLNYTLSRGSETLETVSITVYLQANISGEVVEFVAQNTAISQIVLLPDSNTYENETTNETTITYGSTISYSNITIHALVELYNFTIDNSHLFAWQLKTAHSHFIQSVLHALPSVDANSSLEYNASLIASSFVDTSGIYQGAYILHSRFADSPVQVLSGSCEIRNSSFGNTTTRSALTVQSCYVESSFFGHNTAERGAAITGYAHLQVQSSTFKHNTAHSSGGAIFSDGYLNIFDSVIDENNATIGGGIFIGDGNSGYFDCSNTVVTENVAENGGGVALYGGTMDVYNGCKLSGNIATNQGGGLYIANSTMVGAGLWLFAGNFAIGEGGGVFVNQSYVELSGGWVDNHAESGSAVYAVDSLVLISSSVLQSDILDKYVIELHNSSSKIGQWEFVNFINTPANDSLYCSDCDGVFCKAETDCYDCPDGCVEFGSSAVCTTNHGSKFGCYGSSTCAHVAKTNQTKCDCPPSFHGDLCSEPDEHPNDDSFPKWAIALIVIGGVLVIAVIFVIVRTVKKSPYKPIE